jgi:phosphoribosylamine--glycine ligase
VGAADGYPGQYVTGRVVEFPDDCRDDRWIIHAGTASEDGTLVSSGGRVFGAVGLGDNLEQAREAAYAIMDDSHFEGLIYRRDIGATGSVKNG